MYLECMGCVIKTVTKLKRVGGRRLDLEAS